MLGLLIGSCLAFVRLSTDRRLRSTGQVEDALGAPVLSAVPRIRRRLRLGAGAAGAAAAPGSAAADAFRTIRTALYFGNRGQPSKTLVVTSAVKGEGKSTLATNLAVAMAHAGERILLVDADLRRPSLYRAFKVDNRIGLSSVLNDPADLCDAVRATDVARLDLLTSGPIPSNPTELLGGEPFAALLARLSEGYDRVVLDAPPVLGMADALILGARCDATLLVVRLGVSDRSATEAAFAALVNIGVRSIATVVNAVRHRHAYSHYTRRHYFAGRHRLIDAPDAKPRGPVKAPVRVVGDERRRAVNGAANWDDAKRPDAPTTNPPPAAAAPASAVRVEPQRALATSHSRRKDPFNGGI
jgi:capsular exopolysaccharide synthesis family protein